MLHPGLPPPPSPPSLYLLGDNILTAISVARQCGMVQPRERVVVVQATAPEYGNPAKIQWELANVDQGEEEEEEEEDVGITEDPDSTCQLQVSCHGACQLQVSCHGACQVQVSCNGDSILTQVVVMIPL